MEDYNLILWGTPESSVLVASVMATLSKLGVASWEVAGGRTAQLSLGARKFAATATAAPANVLQLIYQSPFATANGGRRYVLLNSGLTFREAHDTTNSMQNPKLPGLYKASVSSPSFRVPSGG
jgi:hypothetical protein